MIKFPTYNSPRFIVPSSKPMSWKNTAFQDLTNGTGQHRAYRGTFQKAEFNNDDLTFQIETDEAYLYKVELHCDGNVTNFGYLTNPTNGASTDNIINDFYNFTIPINVFGECYIVVRNTTTYVEFKTELFNTYDTDDLNDLTNVLFEIQYKWKTGKKNGYYWTDQYQNISLPYAVRTYDNETETEKSTSLKGEETVLQASTLRVDTYNFINIPYYLYDLITRSAQCSEVYVKGELMTLQDQEISEINNGMVSFKLTLKEGEEFNSNEYEDDIAVVAGVNSVVAADDDNTIVKIDNQETIILK